IPRSCLGILQTRPVTGIAAPWIARAASEARNKITSASASGATQRRGSAPGMSARFCGVSMTLGSTQLTLMPLSRSSADMLSVIRITALFAALYAPMFALPLRPATAPILMIFPRPAASIFGFVDPPYRLGMQVAALAALRGLLAAGGRVYVEGDAAFEPPRGWIVFRRARAGNVHFHILVREADDQGGVSGNV